MHYSLPCIDHNHKNASLDYPQSTMSPVEPLCYTNTSRDFGPLRCTMRNSFPWEWRCASGVLGTTPKQDETLASKNQPSDDEEAATTSRQRRRGGSDEQQMNPQRCFRGCDCSRNHATILRSPPTIHNLRELRLCHWSHNVLGISWYETFRF